MSDNFVPYGSEHWSVEEWKIFKKSPYGFYLEEDWNRRDCVASIDFEGDYTCNDGDGCCSWDGESRRCYCGNRRVCWTFDGSWVYPEAY